VSDQRASSIENGRVGGARNKDQQTGKGIASPGFELEGIFGEREDGCGNDVPVESKKRFPQGLGNLAPDARFPHFHSRSSSLAKKNEKNKTRRTTAATRRQINRPQVSRIFGQSGTGKNSGR
jgi:hypothetical protein